MAGAGGLNKRKSKFVVVVFLATFSQFRMHSSLEKSVRSATLRLEWIWLSVVLTIHKIIPGIPFSNWLDSSVTLA